MSGGHLIQSQVSQSRLLRAFSIKFLICPRLETPQPFWTPFPVLNYPCVEKPFLVYQTGIFIVATYDLGCLLHTSTRNLIASSLYPPVGYLKTTLNSFEACFLTVQQTHFFQPLLDCRVPCSLVILMGIHQICKDTSLDQDCLSFGQDSYML